MAKLNITHFYTALGDAVRHSPPNTSGQKCKQLQTLRVQQLERGIELASQNLGATLCDKDKPFFWSRLWHERGYNPNSIEFQFPALVAFEIDEEVGSAFNRAGAERCFNIMLAVFDVFKDDCSAGNCPPCEGRTINEIFIDTANHLHYVLQYLSKCFVASDGANQIIIHADYLSSEQLAGRLTSYGTTKPLTVALGGENATTTLVHREFPVDKIFGSSLSVQVCMGRCEAITPNFTIPSFATMAQEAGCKDC